MCMIVFLRVIIPKVTKPAFLARVWEWCGIGTDCPVLELAYYFNLGWNFPWGSGKKVMFSHISKANFFLFFAGFGNLE